MLQVLLSDCLMLEGVASDVTGTLSGLEGVASDVTVLSG